ncbi:hypothetical protein FraEuI1c_6385 [Pseudofrankia inefficax]|uniref:Uncharacterized protein n=1 Tax=Pseudofrankia inefficax (strain DSM 45817 / CECT 9037 / DDB 130130 / EuI1c) TaxID=298654 RepID=E3J5Y8_PSEI1|nr:hypothetical protein FraEuI1c_6385 [Pseudofrankia inefficax]
MALNKRGSRLIVVDGDHYRWIVRRKPTYCQGNAWTPLSFAVERANPPGRTALVVRLATPRLDNWLMAPAAPLLPSAVASAIRQALEHGWRPSAPGSPFVLDLGR